MLCRDHGFGKSDECCEPETCGVLRMCAHIAGPDFDKAEAEMFVFVDQEIGEN